MVIQGKFKGHSRAVQRSFKGCSRAVQGSIKGHWRVIEGPFKGCLKAIQVPFNDHSRVIQGLYKGRSRVVKGPFKGWLPGVHQSARRLFAGCFQVVCKPMRAIHGLFVDSSQIIHGVFTEHLNGFKGWCRSHLQMWQQHHWEHTKWPHWKPIQFAVWFQLGKGWIPLKGRNQIINNTSSVLWRDMVLYFLFDILF